MTTADTGRRALLRGLLAAPLLGIAGCTGGPLSLPRSAIDPRADPFRAAGDGIADDTRALQGAIDAATRTENGGAILLPPGRFRLTDTLRIRNARGLRLSGTSSGSTTLEWQGPADRPLLLLDDTRDSVFSDVTIEVLPPHRLHTGIRTENGAESRIAPTHNLFQNLTLEGRDHRGLDYGFRIAVGRGGDANNEFHDFLRCNVANYRIGYSIEHSQSHTNRFYSCSFTGNRAGEAGVQTVSGSFYWYGGGGGGNNVADFLLGSPNVTVSILNANFESSVRLLTAAGPTGARWPITVQGVRFSGDRLHADGAMIDVRNPGPLSLIGNGFGESANQPMPRVRMHANVPGITLVSRGNLWTGKDALAASPYVFVGGGERLVNAAIDGDAFADGSTRDPALLLPGSSRPPVHTGRWFRTGNARRTTVAEFVNAWPGHDIAVLVEDDNTVFDFAAGRLMGNGGVAWVARRGDMLRALFDGTRWRCTVARTG